MTMDVPDPESDRDKEEESFAGFHDNEDGMPGFHAIIHEALSRKPFKVWISWLSSKSNSDFGPLNWVGWAFAKKVFF